MSVNTQWLHVQAVYTAEPSQCSRSLTVSADPGNVADPSLPVTSGGGEVLCRRTHFRFLYSSESKESRESARMHESIAQGLC